MSGDAAAVHVADQPVAVTVTSPDPLPVLITNPERPRGPTGLPVQSQMHDPSVPATTTFQEDLTHAGQRQINLIWERTQATIAIGVTFLTMGAGVYAQVSGTQIPTLMAVAFGTVTGFYFSRTNHAAIGGTGTKVQGPDQGR